MTLKKKAYENTLGKRENDVNPILFYHIKDKASLARY